MGENEDSCPIDGDVGEGGYGASQEVVMYKMIPHLCGQYL